MLGCWLGTFCDNRDTIEEVKAAMPGASSLKIVSDTEVALWYLGTDSCPEHKRRSTSCSASSIMQLVLLLSSAPSLILSDGMQLSAQLSFRNRDAYRSSNGSMQSGYNPTGTPYARRYAGMINRCCTFLVENVYESEEPREKES